MGHHSTLTKEHIERMVSALDATADKTKQIEALQAQLKQAEDRALLYEVRKLISCLLNAHAAMHKLPVVHGHASTHLLPVDMICMRQRRNCLLPMGWHE